MNNILDLLILNDIGLGDLAESLIWALSKYPINKISLDDC